MIEEKFFLWPSVIFYTDDRCSFISKENHNKKIHEIISFRGCRALRA